MKTMAIGCAAITGLMALFLATPAFAQLTNGENVFVDFTNAPDGIYDPYNGTVSLTSGGVALNEKDQIVCDDAKDEISAGETWQGTAYSVAQLLTSGDLSHLTFSNIGLNGYAEAAAMANALLNLPNGASAFNGIPGSSGVITNQDLSLAIWNITNGNSLGGDANAAALVAYLTTNPGSVANYANLWIIVPTLGTQTGTLGMPQEMFFQVPEGGTSVLYLLLAGSVCFGAMRLGSGNQFGSRASA